MVKISQTITMPHIYRFRSSVLFVLLSLFAGGCNYLYYPLMARILSLEDFGASQALIAVLSQAGSLFAGLSLLTIYLVQRISADKITYVISAVQRAIVAVLILLMLFLFIFHTQLATFLNLQDNIHLFIVIIDLLCSVPFVITFGLFLAKKRFISAGILQLVIVILKLLIGAALAHNLRVTGALFAIGLSYILGMMLFWIVSQISRLETWDHSIVGAYTIPTWDDFRLIKPYLLPVVSILVVSACIVIFPTFDVLIARHHLTATSSGLYAAASTVSSILLFTILPIINILIPLLNPDSLRASLPQIRKALCLIALSGLACFLLFVLLPHFTLYLFGKNYTPIADILWIFGLNMFFVCCLVVSIQIIVLYKPILASLICFLTTLGLAGITTAVHSSASTIISSVAFVYATILMVVVIPTFCLLISGEKYHAK